MWISIKYVIYFFIFLYYGGLQKKDTLPKAPEKNQGIFNGWKWEN